jgi:hypothetical protein
MRFRNGVASLAGLALLLGTAAAQADNFVVGQRRGGPVGGFAGGGPQRFPTPAAGIPGGRSYGPSIPATAPSTTNFAPRNTPFFPRSNTFTPPALGNPAYGGNRFSGNNFNGNGFNGNGFNGNGFNGNGFNGGPNYGTVGGRRGPTYAPPTAGTVGGPTTTFPQATGFRTGVPGLRTPQTTPYGGVPYGGVQYGGPTGFSPAGQAALDRLRSRGFGNANGTIGVRRGLPTFPTASPASQPGFLPGSGPAAAFQHYGVVSYGNAAHGPGAPYRGRRGGIYACPTGGHYVAWWRPTYGPYYAPYFVGGYPAFGYGVTFYDSYYDPMFGPGVAYGPDVGGPAPDEGFPEEGMPPEGMPQEGAPEPGAQPQAPAAPEQPPEDAAAQQAAQKAFEEGVHLFMDQHYAESLARFQAMASADEKNGEAWLGIAHSAFALGRYDVAAQAVAKAAALEAFPRGYRFDPKPIYPKEGSFDGFLAALVKHAHDVRNDADAHLLLAYLYVSLGKTSDAQLEIAWLRHLRPNDPTAVALETALEPPAAPEQK